MVRQLVMVQLPGGNCTAALVAWYLVAQGQSFSGMPLVLSCAWVHKHLRQVQLPLADSAT